jgi:ribonuclease HI
MTVDGTLLVDPTHDGGTNNEAELCAIALAAEWADSCGLRLLMTVQSDSMCGVAWAPKLKRHYRVRLPRRKA